MSVGNIWSVHHRHPDYQTGAPTVLKIRHEICNSRFQQAVLIEPRVYGCLSLPS